MEISLYKANFVVDEDGCSRTWYKLLKQLGVVASERSGVYVITLTVVKADIPNATGNLFDYTEVDRMKNP